jgi:hypothetical protein
MVIDARVVPASMLSAIAKALLAMTLGFSQ